MSSGELEKGSLAHCEKVETTVSTVDQDTNGYGLVVEGYTPKEQRKIIHRVDRRLVTMLGCIYCIALVDRTNLSNANIAGMAKDLDLNVGNRYNILNLVFFPAYIFVQLPSIVIIRKLGPRYCISALVVAWGACMIGFGFVQNWQTLIPLRIILGIFEAGFFPGALLLLSTWYSRYDMHKRYASFYLIAVLSQAFAGILAYGLTQMEGVAALRGWRWIFIIEGLLTCLLGVASFFLLVDFPEKAYGAWRFLSDREVRFIVARITIDRDDAIPEPFKLGKYLKAGLDLKVWGFAMIYFCLTTVSYAVAFFLPIILRTGMGFSLAAAQCLVAPPYVFACFLIYLSGWVGDKYHIRGLVLIFNVCITLIGLPLLGFCTNNGVRYFGVFLTTAASNANIPTVMAYQANNIRGQWKRGFCSATFVSAGAVGGITGSLVFRTVDAPSYHPGIYACIACNLMILVVVTLLSIKFRRANSRAASGGKVIEGQAGFRYTL